jgi:hypothetical protein
MTERSGDESDEALDLPEFRCPQPEAVRIKVSFDSIHHRFALLTREECGKELHHAWVCIHTRERLAVGLAPSGKDKTLCGENWSGKHTESLTDVGCDERLRDSTRRTCIPPKIRSLKRNQL